MTSCGRERGSATPECFGRGSQGTIFVRSSKLSLFFPELCSFRRVFCFPHFCKNWRQTFEPWGFWFRRCLGALFENCALSQGTPTTTTSIFENFFSFFKAEPVLLAWKLWWSPGWAKLFGGGSSKTRMETWLPGVGEIERRRTVDRRRVEHESLAVIHGPKERKARRSQPVITLYRLQKPARKPANCEEPVSETRCFYRFAIRCFPVCGCTVARWSGCSWGTAKKSSRPWHFRCWSPSRNNLETVECTNLVHWTDALTEALHRFSSRDAIIVVGSALEKYFDGVLTQDQEKEITFKHWPPGYQSWKLCLAPNALKYVQFVFFFFFFNAAQLTTL